MKINFRRFMAMMLAVLMVFGTFSTLATAAGTATADVCSDGGDHDWIQLGDDKTAIVDPTCTEDGYTWYYCVKCNAKDIRNIKPALGHDFVPSTVKPTCKVDGKYIETCSRCGVTQNEKVLEPETNIIVDFDGSVKEEAGFWAGEHWVAGHRFEWVLDPSTPDPKCGEVAVYWLTCTDHGVNPTDICGWVKEGPVYRVAPHNFGAEDAYHVVKEPTCSEYGIMRFECEHCDEYKDVKIEMVEHTLGEVITGKAPTCTEPGWTDYQECVNCDYDTKQPLPAAGHKYEAVKTNATCTTAGYTTYTCSVCGDTYTEDVKKPLGHAKYEVLTKAPTCTEPGEITWYCWRCPEKIGGVDLPPLGHDYDSVVTAPTCEDDGYTTHTCKTCGDVYTDSTVPATGHEWSEWRCAGEGNCLTPSTWVRYCSNNNCDLNGIQTEQREYGKHPLANRTNIVKYAVNTDNDDPLFSTGDNSTYTDNECWISYDCTLCNKLDIHEKIECENLEMVSFGAPTCNADGEKVERCVDCGHRYWSVVKQETHVPKPVTLHGYAATCTTAGLTDGIHCDECGLDIVKQTVIPALGHTPGAAADCENAQTCTVCGEELAPALGHNYLLNAQNSKPANCTSRGVNEYVCENCGDVKYDYPQPLGHDYTGTPADCENPQVCARGCGEILAPALGHDYTGAPADCDDPQVCARGCGEVLAPALGHTPGTPANCKDDQVCTVCGEVLEESDPLKHPQSYVLGGVAVDRKPTCTVGGEGHYACHYCFITETIDWEELTDEERASLADWIKELLQPAGHNMVPVAGQPATCQTPGWADYEYCSVCGDKAAEQAKAAIPALGADTDLANHGALHFNFSAYEEDGKYWRMTPSCHFDGILWYWCDDCAAAEGYTYNGFFYTVEGSKLTDTHVFGSANADLKYDRTEPSTCTEAGEEIYICQHTYTFCDSELVGGVYTYKNTTMTCGAEVKKPLELAKHTFGRLHSLTPATCTEPAKVSAQCLYCDYYFTLAELIASGDIWLSQVDPLGHDYSGAPATCTDPQVCARGCGEVLVPALGHTPGAIADCVNPQTCTACGEVLNPALGHGYLKTTQLPTCTEPGEHIWTCLRCGHFYGQDIAPLGHDMGDYYTVTEPTCTTTGLKQSDCSRCDHFVTEVIDALDHTYDETVTDPTCTEDGYITVTCARCDYEDVKPGEPAIGHDMGDWITSAEPDCVNQGLKYRDCKNGCGLTETEIIPAKGHKPAEMLLKFMCGDDENCPNGHNIKAPTCTEPGVGYGRLCTVCKSCVNEPGVDHVEIPALGGQCNFVTFDIPVGCENYGFTYTICTRCGDGHGVETQLRPEGKIWNDAGEPVEGIITNYKPATGHDMKTDGKEDATCTTDGYYYEYCANGCGIKNVIGEVIPAKGHDAPNHKDADGNYLDLTVKCGRCGVEIPGHRDAEGNSMFEYRTDMEVKLGANGECIKTCYLIAYCPDKGCEYKKVIDIWLMTKDDGQGNPVPDFDHKMVPDEEYNAAHAGDELNGGEYKEVCAYGCGHYTIDEYDAELDGQIIFDNEIYGSDEKGNVRGDGMIVNGGYMAVKIDISGANLDIWGIQIDMTFDAAKLEFAKDLTEAANAANGFSNQFNSNGGKLKIVSTYDELDENGDRLNLDFSALDVDYITLIFAVKSTAYGETDANILADAFTYTNVEVEDIDHNSPVITTTAFGETRIWKAADLDGNGTLSLGDTNDLMDFVVNFADGAYDARADINWDGQINAADFRAIKKILMNEGLYEGVYEDILDGYIVA